MSAVVEVYPVDVLRTLWVYTSYRRDSGVGIADSVSHLEVPYGFKPYRGVEFLVVTKKLPSARTRGDRHTAEGVPDLVDQLFLVFSRVYTEEITDTLDWVY